MLNLLKPVADLEVNQTKSDNVYFNIFMICLCCIESNSFVDFENCVYLLSGG